MSLTKKCSGCLLDLPFEKFNKCKQASFGIHNHCRECQKKTRRNWYLKHREEELEKSCAYGKTTESKAAAKRRYESDKENILKINRERRKTDSARKLANRARTTRYYDNPQHKISTGLRQELRLYLFTKYKCKKITSLIGCSQEELRNYFESKFANGMTWKNYGYDGWHIDHIVPCIKFDLTQPSEQAKCFHYTNLQPLWKNDNLSKGTT